MKIEKSKDFVVSDMGEISEFNKDNPLRCFFAFEGYNSQGLALNRLKQHFPDFDWVCVGRSEIDKYAIQAADALFPDAKGKNFGDISKISWADVPDFDLFTMSSPCQDFSSAGLQKGGAEGSGTRSSLLWECRRAILSKKPKYIVFENVKALVSQKFLPYFLKWQNELASYGYSNFAKVLNSKCYNIPQNRERIFMVSILDENASYHFPEPFPLDKRLKDILEQEVDEKYYLSKKVIDTFIERNKINEDKGNGFKFEPTDGDCVASSGLTMPGSRPCDNYIKEHVACAMRGREVYGSKHVNNLVESGKIPAGEVAFLDCYNQAVHTDVSATIKASIGKENLMFVSIPQCLTMRRTEHGKQVRRLGGKEVFADKAFEPREDGVSNTITSVQKDNLVIEPFNPYEDDTCRTLKAQYYKNGMANFKRSDGLGATAVAVIGNMYKNNEQGGRIYDAEGMSPTIGANTGGNLQPKIIDGSTQKHAYIGSVEGISPCINAACGMGGGQTPMVVGVTVNPNRSREYKDGKIHSDVSMCITSQEAKNTSFVYDTNYRIRKLTERECFRLMDVDDADIDKIQAAGISRSQQYKMAGNSMCTGVLFHIFRKLFVDKENENKQLTLF